MRVSVSRSRFSYIEAGTIPPAYTRGWDIDRQ